MESMNSVTAAFAGAKSQQVLEEDVVERLYEQGVRDVPQKQLARREGLAVELGDVPVTLGAVVAGVDDRLPGQWRGRHVGEGTDRHRDHDNVTGRRGLFARRRGRPRPSSSAVSTSVPGPRELLSTTAELAGFRARHDPGSRRQPAGK
ncbi:hypothetical protein [Streptomyces shenzhenensis]|uniref:hypothetical protein n=1 Tax=Streptomyces shenzhenensis TaxID=943815 RepID=UPI003F5420E4